MFEILFSHPLVEQEKEWDKYDYHPKDGRKLKIEITKIGYKTSESFNNDITCIKI